MFCKNLKYIFIICCISLTYCDKIFYYPDRPFYDVKTKFIVHKAGCKYTYLENLIPNADSALNNSYGIELDVQISKNKTLWILHEPYIFNCNFGEGACFSETSDNKLISISQCMGESKGYTPLESIFKLMSEKYPRKYISIDVKAWKPCSIDGANVSKLLNDIADEIIVLTNKYEMAGKVMVECETTTFLKHIKKYSSGIETYLTTLGDFERGMLISLYDGYTGMSFAYKYDEEITNDHINLLHKKGLKIQLWTINDSVDLQEAYSLNPDFIQTDNVNLIPIIDSTFQQ